MSDDTKLNDTDRADLIQALRNATPMGRFNPAETAAVLAYMEDAGYVITKQDKKPVPVIEPEPIKTNAAPEGSDATLLQQNKFGSAGQAPSPSVFTPAPTPFVPVNTDPVKPVV